MKKRLRKKLTSFDGIAKERMTATRTRTVLSRLFRYEENCAEKMMHHPYQYPVEDGKKYRILFRRFPVINPDDSPNDNFSMVTYNVLWAMVIDENGYDIMGEGDLLLIYSWIEGPQENIVHIDFLDARDKNCVRTAKKFYTENNMRVLFIDKWTLMNDKMHVPSLERVFVPEGICTPENLDLDKIYIEADTFAVSVYLRPNHYYSKPPKPIIIQKFCPDDEAFNS